MTDHLYLAMTIIVGCTRDLEDKCFDTRVKHLVMTLTYSAMINACHDYGHKYHRVCIFEDPILKAKMTN